MTINEKLAHELNIRLKQVDAAVELLDAGNTVPFISRYRKEVTGGLDDDQLRRLTERLTYLRNLEEKREDTKKLIDAQGKLTFGSLLNGAYCVVETKAPDGYNLPSGPVLYFTVENAELASGSS